MTSFRIRTKENLTIRFKYYLDHAPSTCEAFAKSLPFSRTLIHARVSGQEIWTDDAPVLDIIQENASVFTEPGEIVLGPLKPLRAKTSKCLGIYYGEGKGLDCCNIFGKVYDEDLENLKKLGDQIWKQGMSDIIFENIE
ncbi:MAG TPA: DUF3830 family protein [Bacteroidales bacterium]